jgi:hypothetical protein
MQMVCLTVVGFELQVASPWLQRKRIEEARVRFFRSRALQRISTFSNGPSAQPKSRPVLLLQVFTITQILYY